MAKLETFIISRQELRRVLIAFGMSEKSIESILSSMEKAHRHINAIAFASLLEKAGFDRGHTINLFRRLGIDDISIRSILDQADEQKILAETGRLFNVEIDFG